MSQTINSHIYRQRRCLDTVNTVITMVLKRRRETSSSEETKLPQGQARTLKETSHFNSSSLCSSKVSLRNSG